MLPGSPPDAEALRVLRKFRLIFRATQRHARFVELACGLSGSQLWALSRISEQPGIRASDLAQSMSIERSTLSNLVDKLEARALVRRERGSPDHRTVHLYLTESGAAVLARAPQPARGVLIEALGAMPKEALDQLEVVLDGLLATMAVRDERAALEPLSG